MKFGIMFSNIGNFAHAEHAVALARAAEDVGIESLWTVEHVIVPKQYINPTALLFEPLSESARPRMGPARWPTLKVNL